MLRGKQRVATDLTGLPWAGHASPKRYVEPLRWLGANLGLRVTISADAEDARTRRPSRRPSRCAALFGRFT